MAYGKLFSICWFLLAASSMLCLWLFVRLQYTVYNLCPTQPSGGCHSASSEWPHVTPSDEDRIIILYNRIPKSGSTSFMAVAHFLTGQNSFHTVHVNVSKNSHTISFADQAKLVKNCTTWSERLPAVYHGHFAFLDFEKFLYKNPVYINVVRDPLDRFISYYYFLRYGDDFRPNLKRRKHKDLQTFDDCVAKNGSDCAPEKMWLQIPFFCGHSWFCWIPGNVDAFVEAKYNLIHHYLVVGITEDLPSFVAVLEGALPRVFKGASSAFSDPKRSHLRKTMKKITPSQKTVDVMKRSPVWQLENEFYEFARAQFAFVKKKTLVVPDEDGEEDALTMKIIKDTIRYDKIRPR